MKRNILLLTGNGFLGLNLIKKLNKKKMKFQFILKKKILQFKKYSNF